MTESMTEMLQTLTSVLQGLNVHKASPPVKLSKFRGVPQVAGDLPLQERLDNFENYAHYNLDGSEKAQSLIDHWTGVAKAEILCTEESIRKDPNKQIEVLKSLFGTVESVQSLTAEFHIRKQLNYESLADYSRALTRIYRKMEKAAFSTDERKALEQLRDSSLKDRFVTSTNQTWIKRELRRIEPSSKKKISLSFSETKNHCVKQGSMMLMWK